MTSYYDQFALARRYGRGGLVLCLECGENEAIWLDSVNGETVVNGVEYQGIWWSRCEDCEGDA